jgi:hypothetical protein
MTSSPYVEYWIECLGNSLEEHGIGFTPEQLRAVAEDIQTAYLCREQAFHTPDHPAIQELKTVQKQLKAEQDKRVCKECKGTGTITESWLDRSSTTTCGACHGEGKR